MYDINKNNIYLFFIVEDNININYCIYNIANN